MRIILLDLDLTRPQPVRDGTAIGYPCRFDSELGGGPALLAARSEGVEHTPGRQIEARLLPESITDLRSLPATVAAAPSLAPLPVPGDFEGVGKAASILWLDDEQEHGVLELLLSEELLSIPLDSAQASGETDLAYGEWVVFRMHRLVLLEE